MLLMVLSGVASGCRYERIVGGRRPFEGLPGAVVGGEPTPKQTTGGVDGLAGAGGVGGGGVGGTRAGPIRVEAEDGTITLVSRNPRDLMVHVLDTLGDEEPELFLRQVLSVRTIDRFYEAGYEPVEAYERLRSGFSDIDALLRSMPAGEISANARFENIGINMFRLSVRGKARRGLRWTSFDMVIEDGRWKLLWFGQS
ncbi:MAG: hypothetical protein AAF108_03570 [Planctomycetota bacterium]